MKSHSIPKIQLASFTAVPLLFSCNPDPLSTFSTTYPHVNSVGRAQEKIIGTNDLIPVTEHGQNLPHALRPLIDAIGQVNVGCTATHVGNGLVLTAGHCILASPRSGSKYCRGVAVVWGNYSGNPGQTVSKCREVVFRTYTVASDVALIRVESPPKAFIPLDLKISSSSIALPRSNITMLSFPRMRPLEWSQDCELSKYKAPGQDASFMLDVFSSRAEPTGPIAQSVAKKFLHSCDTEPGSSGAALIDTTTLKIVGVHGGASEELNYGSFLDDIPLHWKEK